MSYGGGSGGGGKIATAADAALSNPVAGDVLTYDAVTQKWKNAVPTAGTLADGAVTTSKLADGVVTAAKIPDATITSAKIVDGTITNGDISGTAAIDQAKISGLSAALAAKIGQPLVIATGAVIPNGTAPTFVIRS